MFYTLTLNPALDHTLSIDGMQEGRTTRAKGERQTAGGISVECGWRGR